MTKKNHPNIRFFTPGAGIKIPATDNYATAADAAMDARAKKLVLR